MSIKDPVVINPSPLETHDNMMEEIERLETELDEANDSIVVARKRIAGLEAARVKLDEVERRYLEWANADDDSDAIAVRVIDSLGDLFGKQSPAPAVAQAEAQEHVHEWLPTFHESKTLRPGHSAQVCATLECHCERWEDGTITSDGESLAVAQPSGEGEDR